MQRFLILFLLTTACLGAQGQQLAPNDYIYPLRELKQRLYSANFGEIRPGHFHAGVDIKTDAVLMDIKMPVMDGIEALKEIRLHTDSLPVIMQTAYAFDTDRRVAEEAGCNGFITKPVMPRELKMYLDKYLTK